MQDEEEYEEYSFNDNLIHQLQNQEISKEELYRIESATDLRSKTVAVLRTVRDPEIPVNIWDLGLIYELKLDGKNLYIKMTVTAPTCPVAETMPEEIKKRLQKFIPDLKEAEIEMVFDPAWSRDMMSEEARLLLDIW